MVDRERVVKIVIQQKEKSATRNYGGDENEYKGGSLFYNCLLFLLVRVLGFTLSGLVFGCVLDISVHTIIDKHVRFALHRRALMARGGVFPPAR